MVLGVRISKEMEEKISHLCALSKRSKSSIVKEALENQLEDMEDYYIALERLEQHRKDGEKAIPWEDVKKDLGLEQDEK